jgi:hypothetical protein
MHGTESDRFEEAGLAALVRAGEARQWFCGHFGATLIAGAELTRSPHLRAPTRAALEALLSSLVAKHSDWFAALGDGPSPVVGVETLLDALAARAGRLRNSSHPTLYTVAGLRVLAARPEAATERVVEGLHALHECSQDDDPKRYYGVPDYFAVVERAAAEREAVDAAEPTSPLDAFRRGMASLDPVVPDQTIDGRRFFFVGEKIHLLTHAHAAFTLEQLGHPEIAARALDAQRLHTRLASSGDELEPSRKTAGPHSPQEPAFWRRPLRDPWHVIKLAEAVVTHLPRLAEDERAQAEQRMRSVWTLLAIP